MSDTPRPYVRDFCRRYFRHFNAGELVRASESYNDLISDGAKMLVSIAGAMSTAEIGICLAEMIRQGKVHAICCTGANLEEDVFNLLAHDSYERIPNYRDLSSVDEVRLRQRGLNRVTDTCIPETPAIRRLGSLLIEKWKDALSRGIRRLPHEYFYEVVLDQRLRQSFEVDPADSWVHAAALAKLPLYVPGWEDSSMGSVLAAAVMDRRVESCDVVHSGIEYFIHLARWYEEESRHAQIGLLQVGGGLPGDFSVSVVPMLREDLNHDVPLWSYFCQISDSTTSYGSYSGAPPNEKITWGKLSQNTPRFVIESDATIVVPLMFSFVLDW